jgi:AraC-like DNA-binding protein
LEGAVNCTKNQKKYCLKAGEFGLCLPYDIHGYIPEENTKYWALVFSEDFVRLFTKEIAGKTGDGFSFHCGESIENHIKEQLVYNDTPSVFILKSCLYAVCDEYKKQVPLIDKKQKDAEIMPWIADYIAENHQRKLSLSDVASKLGYDYNYMSRYFRNVFNMTFTDFVNIYRLETAIKLLEDTDLSITAIAYESGFQSTRSFNTFFKTQVNMSPTEYRKASCK